MSPLVTKIISPFRGLLKDPLEEAVEKSTRILPPGVLLEESFPSGFHVYGFARGPHGHGEVLIGAGDPMTAQGAVFLGRGGEAWRRYDLPDETAFLNRFVRLADGRWLAGGMSAIGRGALLTADRMATTWESVDLDLHPYSSIAAILRAADGSILVSTGQMVTQGKTKPVLFRSSNEGEIWGKEEVALPVSQFLSFAQAEDGTLYGGTAGDSQPLLYRSRDNGRSWEAMPPFPAYKTYKMVALRLLEGQLYVVLWGYKTELADRVVRIYVSSEDFTGWEELPPVEDSHFVFSFEVLRDGTFLAGSEKGKVFRSKDRGYTWETAAQFPTNIGAYAMFEDDLGRIWIGKDYVAPSEFSLWQLG